MSRRGLGRAERAAFPVGLCLGLLAVGNAVAGTADPDAWIAADAPFEMRVADVGLDLGTLRVMVGVSDMTALFRQNAPGVLSFLPGVLPLPVGEQVVAVYRKTDGAGTAPGAGADTATGGETPLYETTIRVLTRSGFEASEFLPSLSVQASGQLDESHHGSAPAPERSHYQDLEMSAGFTARQRRAGWEIESEANVQGVSHREQALRFGELGAEAPKVDLSDYRIALSNVGGEREYGVEVGHVSYGQHPLLFDGVANRGVTGWGRLGPRVDLSAAVMNGSSIVGWDNPFGLDHRDHRVAAFTGGLELFEARPGAARVELVYTEASIQNRNDFGVGEVGDAEKSDGWGVVVKGETEDGRLRGEYNWASARYENPVDPLLDQGFGSQAVTPERNEAESFSVSYQLLDNWVPGAAVDDAPADTDWPVSLAVDYGYERADPLYQTVGGNAQPDQRIHHVDLNASVGPIRLVGSLQNSEDNLDDLPTILKTKTRTANFAIGLPLRDLLGGDRYEAEPLSSEASDGGGWDWRVLLPAVDLAYGEAHQFGVNRPVDFNASHVPDQFDDQWSLDLGWSGERWDLGFSTARGEQDNREAGRVAADFTNVTHELRFNLRPTDTFDVGVSYGFGDAFDAEQNLSRYSDTWGLNLNWRGRRGWSFAGNYSLSDDDDSQGTSSARQWSGSSQLNYEFELPAPGRSLPGSVFVSHVFNQFDSVDNTFGIADTGRSWSIQFGISVTIF